MPTIDPANPYATMNAAQVLECQAQMLARWAAEDAERAARHRAILAGIVSGAHTPSNAVL